VPLTHSLTHSITRSLRCMVLMRAAAAAVGLPLFLKRSAESVRAAAGWAAVGGQGGRRAHVVMGNEACDADSIVSSLCLAWLDDALGGAGGHGDSEGEASPAAVEGGAQCSSIALLPISRRDLALRGETLLLLNRAGIDVKDVMVLDEAASWLQSLSPDALEVTLVDHNRVRGAAAELGLDRRVCRIVDHHVDEAHHPEVSGSLRDVAYDPVAGQALVGSACTLVAERLFKVQDRLSRDTMKPACILLYGVILLDTINLSPSAGRATDRDITAIKTLEEIVPDLSSERSSLFEAMSNAKFDPIFWDGLSVDDCLRFDYKRFDLGQGAHQAVGISAVLIPVEQFVSKEGVTDVMESFMIARDLSLLLVSTFSLQPQKRRSIILFHARKAGAVTSMALGLECLGADLLLAKSREEDLVGGGKMIIFEQGNIQASRKQLGALILEHLASCEANKP
jgi:exopolyphosphatase